MKQTWQKVLLITAALLVLAFVIWVIASADTTGLPPFITNLYNFPNGDKLGHFLLMGALAFCVTLALPRRWQLPGLGALALLLAAEEFSQRFFNRNSDWLDLACSLAGAAIFGVLALWLTRRKISKNQTEGS